MLFFGEMLTRSQFKQNNRNSVKVSERNFSYANLYRNVYFCNVYHQGMSYMMCCCCMCMCMCVSCGWVGGSSCLLFFLFTNLKVFFFGGEGYKCFVWDLLKRFYIFDYSSVFGLCTSYLFECYCHPSANQYICNNLKT